MVCRVGIEQKGPPPGRPVLLGNFAGGGGEALERFDQRGSAGPVGHGPSKSAIPPSAPIGDGVDQVPAHFAVRGQPDQPAVAPLVAAGDQSLADQPVAHPGGGRRGHVHRLGEGGPGSGDPVMPGRRASGLGERHPVGDVTQRSGRHGHQHSAGRSAPRR